MDPKRTRIPVTLVLLCSLLSCPVAFLIIQSRNLTDTPIRSISYT